MLVNHSDAVCNGVAWGAKSGGFAGDSDLPGIGLVQAIDEIHQGGFAGAVFTQNGMDFALL